MNPHREPNPQGPPQVTPTYIPPPPLKVLKNPIPPQGVINTQIDLAQCPHAQGQFPPLNLSHSRNTTDHSILLTIEEEIFLQTVSLQYNTPPDPLPTSLVAPHPRTEKPFMIPCPNTESITHMPHKLLRRNVHNPHAHTTHSYILIDDLTQSHVSMSAMEVFQTYLSQQKELLS
jgi:hypothetical protein